jgi:hypothetical protein
LILAVALLSSLFMATGVGADPPSQSGPIVFRHEGNWGWAYVDSGLLAVHGFDVGYWCALGCQTDEEPSCFATHELHKLREIVSPAEIGLLMYLLKGDDLTTTVWPWEGGLCRSVNALQGVPLASGTVDLIITDNDFATWLYDHHRKNTVHTGAHGVVETLDGERFTFSGHIKCIWHVTRQPVIKCKNKITMR